MISFILLVTSTVNTTYGYIVTSTDSIMNIFVPDEVSVGGVSLIKTVEHPLGSNYKIPDHISFDFKVELGSYYANASVKTSVGEMTADADGNLTVAVKPGTTLCIEGLEEGTSIKVTEQETSLVGFSVKGDASKEVTVGADGNATVEFVNTYTPASIQPSNISVIGTKVLEGRPWQDGDTFSFTLEQKNGDSWEKLGTKTITYRADQGDFNKFDFSDVMQGLTLDQVGTYTFRMTEVAGEHDHMDYDETVNHFAVKVTDVDMDGSLEISTVDATENATVIEENGVYTVSVLFNNTFVPPVQPDAEEITVDISVNKTVHNTGDLEVGPEGFEFVLEDLATGETIAVTSDANGNALFHLTFGNTDIGKTYTYALSETNEGVVGMTYDADVHQISVTVELDSENHPVVSLTMDGTAVEILSAAFENTYYSVREPSPPTDNNSSTVFWFGLMILSGSLFVTLIVYEKKRGMQI